MKTRDWKLEETTCRRLKISSVLDALYTGLVGGGGADAGLFLAQCTGALLFLLLLLLLVEWCMHCTYHKVSCWRTRPGRDVRKQCTGKRLIRTTPFSDGRANSVYRRGQKREVSETRSTKST